MCVRRMACGFFILRWLVSIQYGRVAVVCQSDMPLALLGPVFGKWSLIPIFRIVSYGVGGKRIILTIKFICLL